MKILVCLRPDRNGEFSPFEMSAYEMALRLNSMMTPNTGNLIEIGLLCMAPEKAKDPLLMASRLGAKTVYLMNDPAFAGSDTLATSYILSKAVEKLQPDLIFCGRKTMEGDTAQVPCMLAEMTGRTFYSGVYDMELSGDGLTAIREDHSLPVELPAVIAAERSLILRRPRLGSKLGELSVLSAADLETDPARTGWNGSPTRVLETHENTAGRRRCMYPDPADFWKIVEACRGKSMRSSLKETEPQIVSEGDMETDMTGRPSLDKVFCVGDETVSYGKMVSDDIRVLDPTITVSELEELIMEQASAILFPSSPEGKEISARLASRMGLGLCADCTSLETDGQQLFMIRPALAGSVVAKILSRTKPALCTVRTGASDQKDLYLCAGYGAREEMEPLKKLAETLNGEFAATRRMVDAGVLPYDRQVGLTGKTVTPSVYIAIGVSGAVHHLAGMDRAGTVIAVNSDSSAPIFDYADYGFVMDAGSWLEKIKEI